MSLTLTLALALTLTLPLALPLTLTLILALQLDEVKGNIHQFDALQVKRRYRSPKFTSP